ncbi:MAG: putative selenate reductase subunit YgfK, partial [Bacteroidales bacterium]
MPAKFYPVSLSQLLRLLLHELDNETGVFGIPQELFFAPRENEPLRTEIFGHRLHSPLGVAPGPHTQLAQNIVAAWLMGSRYIELKTVQTLDEIEVPKPCIDMQDEGYNCEWSQELTIKESFDEYLNAWIIIHILNHRFGWGNDPGTVFNMSAGYNLQGILNANVQWFIDKMGDCSEELAGRINEIIGIYPAVAAIGIPSAISDNITLSTMHGCPADEIEDIARYLLEKRKLHTLVKLNPTLLGPEMLREILNDKLRFKTIVPDEAFGHDLKYPDAVRIIKSLQKTAAENNLQFGLKLTNTLESLNNKNVFGNDVSMMYMSGRALHPISVNLARKLQEEFSGELLLSFSAGANAFNISDLLSCGFRTVTTCSDLLKPGGYMRLNQYFDELNKSLRSKAADGIDDYITRLAGQKDLTVAALYNLSRYSAEVLTSKEYRREYIKPPDIKTDRPLGYFDCISAPCRDTCATSQDIPEYLRFTAAGQFDKAYEVILRTNPFPSVTGMVCDHLCQGKCTRINYDDPLQIREVKRFISEQDEVRLKPAADNGLSAAVIGAGPSGLSFAYYLRMAGFRVDVFEAKSKAGGMVQYAIPGFRLTDEAVANDIRRITDLGVNINYNTPVDTAKFVSLKKDYSYIFIGSGAQLSSPLELEGADAAGVLEPLEFLFRARKGEKTGIGKRVVIIGGGNTAMDAARTAYRLAGEDGRVTIVYRRTVNEMPADQGEIKAVIEEGMEIIELASPEKVFQQGGRVAGLQCSRMELKGFDKAGRPAPVKIEGSAFEIPCDTIISAIGQLTDIGFASREELAAGHGTYKTRLGNVYIGGDAMRGASTAINAIGDGRKAAEQVIRNAGIDFSIEKPVQNMSFSTRELLIRRSKRISAEQPAELTTEQRRTFSLVSMTQDRDTVVNEAERCLSCDEMCSICTTVCPNLANRSYNLTPRTFILQKAASAENGEIHYSDDGSLEIKQKYQIINIANFCNECGNCNTFCPTAGAPWKDKPKFYLTVPSFNQAEEGYFLSVLRNKKNLIYKLNGNITTLSEFPDEYVFENDYVTATFSKKEFRLTSAKFNTPCVREAHFRQAAEMSVLLKAAENLL